MRNLWIYIFTATLVSLNSPALAQYSSPTAKEIVYYLASEEAGGRFPGSKGDSVATNYIVEYFAGGEVEPFFENSYLQPFEFPISQRAEGDNKLSIGNDDLTFGEDFMPMAFSSSSNFEGDIYFAGFGLYLDTDYFEWNDYRQDITGKCVLILRDLPENPKIAHTASHLTSDRSKALLAQDRGASAVIFVNNLRDTTDKYVTFYGRDYPLDIPVIQMNRKTAEKYFGADMLAQREISYNNEPGEEKSTTELLPSIEVGINVNIAQVFAHTNNVAAILRANNESKSGQYIIVGAHHDHLGYGGPGSGSRKPNEPAIHYGADDNASGVAAVLTLSNILGDYDNHRNIVFVTFGAEEKGLVGSKFFADHMGIPADSIAAMINFDMIGNLRNSSLTIGGTGTAVESDSLLQHAAAAYDFKLGKSPQGHGPSDHASFYARNIPVLYLTTGGTMEYHTPEDHPSQLNYGGMDSVILFAADLIRIIDSHENMLTFREAGSPDAQPMRAHFKITLGLMPDVAGTSNEGLRADIVVAGKPAHNAGLRSGDIILEMDGKKINNIEDYMARLAELREGDEVVLLIESNGERKQLIVQPTHK